MVKRDGSIETIMSLVDQGSATISIVPALNPQEVGLLAFMAQQCTGRLSCHGSGDSKVGLSCISFPKGATESYQSTNIHSSTMRQTSVSGTICCCLFIYILYLLWCFIMIHSYLWYTLFIWYPFLLIGLLLFIVCLCHYSILLKIVLFI